MKIIFLDCDGVINNLNYFKNVKEKKDKKFYGENIDFDNLMNVRYIVKETNSQIVLTSTRRKNQASLDANGKVPSTQLNKDYIIVTSEPSVNDLVDGQLAYILNSDDDGIIGYSATSKKYCSINTKSNSF